MSDCRFHRGEVVMSPRLPRLSLVIIYPLRRYFIRQERRTFIVRLVMFDLPEAGGSLPNFSGDLVALSGNQRRHTNQGEC